MNWYRLMDSLIFGVLVTGAWVLLDKKGFEQQKKLKAIN